jgi:hypothetical protein
MTEISIIASSIKFLSYRRIPRRGGDGRQSYLITNGGLLSPVK